jgi:hypothetical protein
MTSAVGGRPVRRLDLRAGVGALSSRIGVTAVLLGGTAWVGIGDPNAGGFFPRCVYLQATGHWCPGCGGLRAVHDLLHGDIGGALNMNVVVTVLLIPLGIVGLGWWWLKGLGFKVPDVRISPRVAWALPALLGAFWILRNIPALEPYLAP